jgi:uncharacterized membrane protein YgcG
LQAENQKSETINCTPNARTEPCQFISALHRKLAKIVVAKISCNGHCTLLRPSGFIILQPLHEILLLTLYVQIASLQSLLQRVTVELLDLHGADLRRASIATLLRASVPLRGGLLLGSQGGGGLGGGGSSSGRCGVGGSLGNGGLGSLGGLGGGALLGLAVVTIAVVAITAQGEWRTVDSATMRYRTLHPG